MSHVTRVNNGMSHVTHANELLPEFVRSGMRSESCYKWNDEMSHVAQSNESLPEFVREVISRSAPLSNPATSAVHAAISEVERVGVFEFGRMLCGREERVAVEKLEVDKVAAEEVAVSRCVWCSW